jgi:hypothetical protein
MHSVSNREYEAEALCCPDEDHLLNVLDNCHPLSDYVRVSPFPALTEVAMSVPSSDSAAIRQTIRAFKEAGVVPFYVEYGSDEGEKVEGASEQAIIDAIMAVDDAYLLVRLPDGSESHVRYVMGNDPEEVVCDYGVSLSFVLDALTESWWAA